MTALSRNKGAQFERDVARYLREHGFPHAERCRDNGFRTADRAHPDSYDLQGVPGFLIDAKNYGSDTSALVPQWLRKAEDDAGVAMAMVVVKRRGHTDPGKAWAYVSLAVMCALTGGTVRAGISPRAPICLPFADLVAVMRAAGYGSPMENGDAS